MNLPELAIRRHVLTYMVNGLIVLFGIIAFFELGVARMPNVDIPLITITTVQPGGNPTVIDSSITNIIERKVNSIPGIDFVKSASTPSVSSVQLNFHLSKDIDVAFNEVQTKVNQILTELPADADPPVIAKVETDAQAVIWLHLQGNRTIQQLNMYGQNVLRRQLEKIDGVGDIFIGGLRERTLRVELQPDRLIAMGMTVEDVINAFRNEHILLPGGFLTSAVSERLLKLDLEYHSARELGEIVIGYVDSSAITLDQVADIKDGVSDFRQLMRRNGEPLVGLGVVKVSGGNTVAIIDEVKRVVEEEIRPQLPPGMTIKFGSDQSSYILAIVLALQEHLVLGTLLAAGIVMLFLRNLRATLIIGAAIPVSLFAAMAAMYFLDFTFNSMSLLGLLLLVGVVVDDAIVVLENIYRHREDIDPNPMSAAVNGTGEVVFAVLAATASLVAIFLPVVFMEGMVGRFFTTFALVVVIGVIASWFVSMTLTPMMCARYLKVGHSHGKAYMALENFFDGMERNYKRLVGWVLRHRWGTLGVATVVVATSVFFFNAVGKEFMPETDVGRIMVILKTPMGSSIEYTDKKVRELEALMAEEESLYNFISIGLFSQSQVNESIGFIEMIPQHDRSYTQEEFLDEFRKKLPQLAGVRVFATVVPTLGGGRGEKLQFALRGPNLDEVARLAREMRGRMLEAGGMGRLDLDLQLDMPQMKLEIDRVRAHSIGLTARQVANAANVLAGGLDIAKYNDEPGDGERYDVRLKAAEGTFRSPQDLKKIYLRAKNGELVRLDTVASFREILGPARIDRINLQYAAQFYTDPDGALGDAVTTLNRVAEEILPIGYSIEMLGTSREFKRTMASMAFAFGLALVLLYMVLASQFDSFLQPLVIMSAQPLAMIGGLALLWASGHTLNIYSIIGLVLLIGLVAKNSILLIDLTNQRRSQGLTIAEALKDACPTRLRPVLMTSLTVILSMAPAAMGYGPGADRNGPLSVAVIGGMITSTLLTLVVVPVVYSLIENAILRLQGRKLASAIAQVDYVN
ncbi:MAG: efflux RND transporter permease subunit [Immundisolibacteraceae bacterium]|nr:efflux RND transporter permease subunit [Immundisolibacteraceae bacterium]